MLQKDLAVFVLPAVVCDSLLCDAYNCDSSNEYIKNLGSFISGQFVSVLNSLVLQSTNQL